MRSVVLDTQVWLDWLVFDDLAVAPFRNAQAAGRIRIAMDDACEGELIRVLGYDLGKFTLDADAQRQCLARFRRLTHRVATIVTPGLPACRDRDDQKFLEVAAYAGAVLLATRDQALLELARRPLPFRIARPDDPGAVLLISENPD